MGSRCDSTRGSFTNGAPAADLTRQIPHSFVAAHEGVLIYRRTGNLRVQLLLGHSKIESTVRYLGIEVEDALSISEQVDF